MLATISLYNCIICGTLECEHMHFEISMAMSYVFVECKYADLWSFDISGGATRIEPSTGRVHPWEEYEDDFHPLLA